jgi:hypothetical protein
LNKRNRLIRLISIPLFLYTLAGIAQDEDLAGVPGSEADARETIATDREVEINEDNYRQFMELRDAGSERNILPETAYQSRAGLQKIEELPEESQKHLRNKLREIIINGDEWQPGDEATDHPYVPSVAAGTDPALQKLEAEAWGELVDHYHKREAEIYANSSRSMATGASDGASGSVPGGNTGGGEGSGSNGAGQDGVDQQANQQSDTEQSSSADNYSPIAANEANAVSTAGSAQNALEFLKSRDSAVTSQPLPELPSLRGPATSGSDDEQDTLAIEDLINAQGVQAVSGSAAPLIDPSLINMNNADNPVDKPVDKDSDGE